MTAHGGGEEGPLSPNRIMGPDHVHGTVAA
jgi:hypothetical protein